MYGKDISNIQTPSEFLRGLKSDSSSVKTNNKGKRVIPYYSDRDIMSSHLLGASGTAITGGGDISTNTGTDLFVVGGTVIDASKKPAILVGYAIGLQTDPSVAGSCVYSSIALLVVYDSYTSNLERVIKGLIFSEWYSAVVYNFLHVISNTLGFYEYCNIGYILDSIAFFVGLDLVNIIEIVTRTGIASVKEIPALLQKMKAAVSGNNPNYLDFGNYSGQLTIFVTNQVSNS